MTKKLFKRTYVLANFKGFVFCSSSSVQHHTVTHLQRLRILSSIPTVFCKTNYCSAVLQEMATIWWAVLVQKDRGNKAAY